MTDTTNQPGPAGGGYAPSPLDVSALRLMYFLKAAHRAAVELRRRLKDEARAGVRRDPELRELVRGLQQADPHIGKVATRIFYNLGSPAYLALTDPKAHTLRELELHFDRLLAHALAERQK